MKRAPCLFTVGRLEGALLVLVIWIVVLWLEVRA